MSRFLNSTQYIDYDHQLIQNLAQQLSSGLDSEVDIARACYEFVRDEIKHTSDHQIDVITCKASDVLKHGTGYCYAKSHLLAALMRANNIPAGLCYQRLNLYEDGAPYCLHGLNSVFLKDYGWCRLDARGNKEGVDAQFNPPNEQLAFPITEDNEFDLIEIYSEPMPKVVEVLEKYDTWKDVIDNLPDVELSEYT